MSPFVLSLLALCLVVVKSGAETRLGCMSKGNLVDWWIVLKYPGGHNNSFLDSTTIRNCYPGSTACWRSGQDLLDQSCPLQMTLLSLENAASTGYLMYNDEESGGIQHWTSAHAKGVLALDESQGFWISHSAPAYPLDPSEPDFARLRHPQTVYGQHFLCLTISAATGDDLAGMLAAAEPFVYAHYVPGLLREQLKNFSDLAEGFRPQHPEAQISTFSTVAGLIFQYFAKPRASHWLIHEHMVEPYYDVDMMWETWRHGSGALPSFCTPSYVYDSLNIAAVAFVHQGVAWEWGQDHSKWGLSTGEADSITCMGDMNREAPQAFRGGGFACFEASRPLWLAFQQLVVARESCPPELVSVA